MSLTDHIATDGVWTLSQVPRPSLAGNGAACENKPHFIMFPYQNGYFSSNYHGNN